MIVSSKNELKTLRKLFNRWEIISDINTNYYREKIEAVTQCDPPSLLKKHRASWDNGFDSFEQERQLHHWALEWKQNLECVAQFAVILHKFCLPTLTEKAESGHDFESLEIAIISEERNPLNGMVLVKMPCLKNDEPAAKLWQLAPSAIAYLPIDGTETKQELEYVFFASYLCYLKERELFPQ